MITLRAARERGHAQHGWLDSWHSFSFADYHDPRHMHWGPLRVINEDRVAPGQGFGAHSHRDMEILSYVIEGALAHQDSLGNGASIVPGEVQRMSAGRGVTHSEFNHSPTDSVHFLQIWLLPKFRGMPPGYEQKFFAPEEKRGRLRLIASPTGVEGSVSVGQDVRLYAGLFDPGESAELPLAGDRLAYVHVVRGHAVVDGRSLTGGDALLYAEEPAVRIDSGAGAEILVFDLPRLD